MQLTDDSAVMYLCRGGDLTYKALLPLVSAKTITYAQSFCMAGPAVGLADVHERTGFLISEMLSNESYC